MKRLSGILALVLCLAFGLPGAGETLTFDTFSADSEAEYLNYDLNRLVNYEAFYEFLSKFPNLKKVDMFNVTIRYKKVKEIHERFPDIEFGMTMRFGENASCGGHTLRTDATAFSTLHGYNPPWHSCKEMEIVKYCKNLYALDLGHNQFEDLSFLYDMPQLRVLIIAAGDAVDITPIGSLKHLEYLEIFNNRIRDISCLKDMPYLMDLNIVSNLIDDIEPVKELKSLKRLWIFLHTRKNQNPIDAETMAELQAALPECHIDGENTSTAGGWREHSHYDTIYRMFRSRVYEPFIDSPAENIPEGVAPAPAVETESVETESGETGGNGK